MDRSTCTKSIVDFTPFPWTSIHVFMRVARQGMLATLTSLSKTCEGKRQDYPVIYSRKLKITTEILTVIAFLISKNVQSGIQKTPKTGNDTLRLNGILF